MKQTVLNSKIEPRFILDGEPVYAIDDLTGAARLLRPAEAPGAEALLRATVHSRNEAAGSMLRPAVAEESDHQPI